MGVSKCRYFCGLVYPESAPSNWVEQLRDSFGAYAISPLHEPEGEELKPHYHVMYCHGNTVSLAAAKSMQPSGIFANDHIEPCMHPRAYQRYLIHLDNPDKQQFDGGVDAITVLNCFPLDLSREFTRGELMAMKVRCFEICDEHNFVEYCDLLDHLREYNFDLFDYASNHTVMFNGYLTSKRCKEEYLRSL